MSNMKDDEEVGSIVVAFRADRRLAARADEAAAKEGLSRSDIARRALLRDLADASRRQSQREATAS
jgi:hypothetical protein